MKSLGIDWRGRAHHLIGGAVISVPLFFGAAVLSGKPEWQSLPPDTGLVRLSFTHSGARNCRERTADELASLPKNMRAAKVCERHRAPVRIEMDVDGRTELATDLKPSGLFGSGPSRIYHRMVLPGGTHHVELKLNDDPAVKGFTHKASFDIRLAPEQSVAIDFDPLRGGFFLH